MDRQTAIEHLAQAEKHVALGAKLIEKQRESVDLLDMHGHDGSQARALLVQFEKVQATYVADRDRLLAEVQELRAAE
jgi:hypothetical protein